MEQRLADAMAALRSAATDHDLANLDRFGIVAPSALGVSMANLQKIAKHLAATISWPPPCGRPASTRPGCWPASSTIRPW